MAKASGSIDLKSLKVAGAGATSYITTINEGGIKVHDAGDDNNYVQLDSNGLKVYQGGSSLSNKVAEFSSDVIIGKTTPGNSHIDIGDDTITFYDGVGVSGFINLKSGVSSQEYRQVLNNWEDLVFNCRNPDDPDDSEHWTRINIDYPPTNNTFNIELVINDETYTFQVSVNGTPTTRDLGGNIRSVTIKYYSNGQQLYISNPRIVEPAYSKSTDTIQIKYQIERSFPSFSFGTGNKSTALNSFAEGYVTIASGDASHAEGYSTTATDRYSHAEGGLSTASGFVSHAEGYDSTASGDYSHAEGRSTIVSGDNSHAEGSGTVVIGNSAHAEGGGTEAEGNYSHAEGNGTKATGLASHAQNYVTVAGYAYQTAIGKYNSNNSNNALEIGNGTSDTTAGRSNAFEVDWSGNVVASGDITDGSGNVLSNKINTSSLATVATSGSYSDLSNKPTISTITDSVIDNVTRASTSAGTNYAYTTSNGEKTLIFAIGAGQYHLFLANTTSSGTCTSYKIGGNNTEVTITNGTNKLTLKNTSNAQVVFLIFKF